jgi:hypothetical protein
MLYATCQDPNAVRGFVEQFQLCTEVFEVFSTYALTPPTHTHDTYSLLCLHNDIQSTCQSLYLISYVVKSLVYLGIVVGMNFTVAQLRAMLANTPWLPSIPIQVCSAHIESMHMSE